jgi:type IV pilus assembly protein PilF
VSSQLTKYRTSFKVITSLLLLFLLVSCSSRGKTTKAEMTMDMATNAYQMGNVHFNDGRYLEALKSHSRAVELVPDEAKFHNALALAYGARGLYDLSKEHFAKSIALDPMYSEAYLNLSALYLNEREWDKAIETAKGALENVFYKTPEFAYYNIARGMINKDDFQGAIISLKKAVDINPRYRWGYNYLGLALERVGREGEAEEAYLSAINIDDNFAPAHLNLGALLMRGGEKSRALKEFNATVEAAPGSSWAISAERYIEELKATQ